MCMYLCMFKAACAHACTFQVVLWLMCGVYSAFSLIYIGLAIATATNIEKAILIGPDADAFKTGLMTAVVVGILVVWLFMLLFLGVMLGHVLGAQGQTAHGFTLGFSFAAAVVMFLSGLLLHVSLPSAERQYESSEAWSKRDLDVYVATLAFSYILCGTFCVICFVMLIFSLSLPPPAALTPAPSPVEAAPQKHSVGPHFYFNFGRGKVHPAQVADDPGAGIAEAAEEGRASVARAAASARARAPPHARGGGGPRPPQTRVVRFRLPNLDETVHIGGSTL
ncbi:hypothetical protein FOA52_000464 [Chlamydomonas sp. UWO 241]|nr:hypothetical protein FOA52_000464 [Chlamydomonas sp. UWO 241]